MHMYDVGKLDGTGEGVHTLLVVLVLVVGGTLCLLVEDTACCFPPLPPPTPPAVNGRQNIEQRHMSSAHRKCFTSRPKRDQQQQQQQPHNPIELDDGNGALKPLGTFNNPNIIDQDYPGATQFDIADELEDNIGLFDGWNYLGGRRGRNKTKAIEMKLDELIDKVNTVQRELRHNNKHYHHPLRRGHRPRRLPYLHQSSVDGDNMSPPPPPPPKSSNFPVYGPVLISVSPINGHNAVDNFEDNSKPKYYNNKVPERSNQNVKDPEEEEEEGKEEEGLNQHKQPWPLNDIDWDDLDVFVPPPLPPPSHPHLYHPNLRFPPTYHNLPVRFDGFPRLPVFLPSGVPPPS